MKRTLAIICTVVFGIGILGLSALGKAYAGPDPQPPGDTVGCTSYDYVHHGSMGRQISYDGNPSHWVHFVWARYAESPTNREVAYNAYNPVTEMWEYGSDCDAGTGISGANGGFPTCDVQSSNGGLVVAWHETEIIPVYSSYHAVDSDPPNLSMTPICAPPDLYHNAENCEGIMSGSWEYTSRYMWPIVDFKETSDGDKIVHIVTTEAPPVEALPDEVRSIIYYRYVNGVLDFCEDPPFSSLGHYIDKTYTVNAVVRSHPDPANERVAIVYLKPVYEEGHPNDICGNRLFQHDVVYCPSFDNGATWYPPINITDYCQGGTLTTDRPMANDEVAAIFSPTNAQLHVVWTTPLRDDEDPCVVLRACKLWHWVNDGSGEAYLVYDASTPENQCPMGLLDHQIAISRINLSYCDGRYYTSFTRFGFDTSSDGLTAIDCSDAGYPNGDICLSVSPDNGWTWYTDEDAPVYDPATNRGDATPVSDGNTLNITNTYTPDCVEGDCHSEDWATMVKYSTDSLHIFYMDDNDAGSSLHGQGSSTENALKYVKHPCFDVPSYYVCGDFNGNFAYTTADFTALFSYLWVTPDNPPVNPDAVDIDSISGVNNHDLFSMYEQFYYYSPPPVCPPHPDSVLPVSSADVLTVMNATVPSNTGHWEVELHFSMDSELPTYSYSLPLAYWCETSDLDLDSISFVGSIYDPPWINMGIIDNESDVAVVGTMPSGYTSYAGAYEGLVASLWFTLTPDPVNSQEILIDTAITVPNHNVVFSQRAPLVSIRPIAYIPEIMGITPKPSYKVGDSDGSGEVDIDDVVYVIAYIFAGGPAPSPLPAGDADCSGEIDIDDVVYVIAYIFSGGPPPGDPNDDGVPDC